MKQSFVIFLAALFLISGCLQQPPCPISRTITDAQQRRWLKKAYRYDKNGWIFLHIEGTPFKRGFQRGFLTANEIDEFYKTLSYIQQFQSGKDIEFFVKASNKLFKNKVSPEYIEEMQGMVAGMRRAGKEISFEQMLFMNGFIEVVWYWWPQEKQKNPEKAPGCSAFIATGSKTANGKIVMAHNSWAGYALIRFCNLIVEIVPETGNSILMQSWGPCIYSATDFFLTSAGLVGCETTIGNFKGFNPKGRPVFDRTRQAMQYAEDIDEWSQIMLEKNNGAYANSWLLGDINTGEIARLELGLKHHRLEKKTDGFFSGSNIADDIKILREETTASYDDIRDRSVTRRERWKQLMKQYHGKIDTEIAKKMLADHYDMYLQQKKPSSRTICGHFEVDDGRIPTSRPAYSPLGAVDGKVLDSEMAKKWQFWARWASSCDIGFDADEFLKKHTQYDWLDGYLKDLPAQDWTVFPDK